MARTQTEAPHGTRLTPRDKEKDQMADTSAAPEPHRGIFESDAAPGCSAHVLYVGGRRVARVEISDPETREEVITFLWRLLCARDRHLSLVE